MGKWVKCRTSSSSSLGDWRFVYLRDSLFEKKEDEYYLVRELEEFLGANTSHELYHGVKWQIVNIKDIPKEVLTSKIKSLKNRHKDIFSSIEFLEKEAKKCKNIEYTLKCKSCNGTGRAFDFIRKKGQPWHSLKGRKVFKHEVKMFESNGKMYDANACIRCDGTGRKKDYNTY